MTVLIGHSTANIFSFSRKYFRFQKPSKEKRFQTSCIWISLFGARLLWKMNSTRLFAQFQSKIFLCFHLPTDQAAGTWVDAGVIVSSLLGFYCFNFYFLNTFFILQSLLFYFGERVESGPGATFACGFPETQRPGWPAGRTGRTNPWLGAEVRHCRVWVLCL